MELNVTPELVRAVADLASVGIRTEDVDSLVALMTNQIAMAASLRALDFSDVPPITTLDPRWT
jgi:Asp-tRNA(Asn)/Glu-tRNA(Gln) amidotransferase C subunit